MTRRSFLLASSSAALASCVRPAPDRGSFDILDVSLSDLSHGLREHHYTSAGLARWYLDRIDAIDRRGPKLNSVIELNPDALKLADELDRELKVKGPRSPLHGVPILLKDNIDTHDAMTTTAGSLALEGWIPPDDAFIAARLRAAGALLFGKTNLSEWANFRSSRSSSGWSGRGGQTLNPHALDRSPSGSSSGSGAAVAASLCAAAIGTETDGSIVSPAGSCGIVGVKPTLGLLSRSGIIPISHSQDTAGPMTRSVRDAAILLSALAGVDTADAATTAPGREAPNDYAAFLDSNGLRGARLGIARKFFERNELINRFLDTQVEILRKCGAEIVDPADLPSYGKYADPEFEVLLYEFKAGLNSYLSRLPAKYPARSIEQLIRFNEKNKEREMPWFGQEILIKAQEKGPLSEKKYIEERAACLKLTRGEGIDAVIAANKLDAIIAITGGPAWMIDHVNGDYDTGSCSTPPAIAGYPHITVPAGLVEGLPIGLSFFGPAWSEPTLFRLAYSYESETHALRRPGLKVGQGSACP